MVRDAATGSSATGVSASVGASSETGKTMGAGEAAGAATADASAIGAETWGAELSALSESAEAGGASIGDSV